MGALRLAMISDPWQHNEAPGAFIEETTKHE
jgi:hypothetical protein